MKKILSILLVLIAILPSVSGAMNLDQFLDDIFAESSVAIKSKKTPMVIVWMNGCPSCEKLDEWISLNGKDLDGFAIYGVNINGSVELSVGGMKMTEKGYAKTLGVYATPTAYVIDETGFPVKKAVGYEAVKALLMKSR